MKRNYIITFLLVASITTHKIHGYDWGSIDWGEIEEEAKKVDPAILEEVGAQLLEEAETFDWDTAGEKGAQLLQQAKKIDWNMVKEKGTQLLQESGKIDLASLKEKGAQVLQQAKKFVNLSGRELRERLEKAEKIAPLSAWVSPNQRLRLDQVSFLASHNAFSNLEEGFFYPQQQWSIKRQLERGVRSLLLDFHEENGVPKMCHGDCKVSRFLLLPGSAHKTATDVLRTVKEFLINNPQEIVVLELENYVAASKIANALRSAGAQGLLLTKEKYNPDNYNGNWPTIGQLIGWNKRLIIFDTAAGAETYGYNTNKYMVRNMYGTTEINKAAKKRPGSSATAKLFQMNLFPTISFPKVNTNSPENLRRLLAACRAQGYIPDNKFPNFVSLDFINIGDPMA